MLENLHVDVDVIAQFDKRDELRLNKRKLPATGVALLVTKKRKVVPPFMTVEGLKSALPLPMLIDLIVMSVFANHPPEDPEPVVEPSVLKALPETFAVAQTVAVEGSVVLPKRALWNQFERERASQGRRGASAQTQV